MDRKYLRHMRTLARVSEVDLSNESDTELIERIVRARALLCISDMNCSHESEKEFLVTVSILNIRQLVITEITE